MTAPFDWAGLAHEVGLTRVNRGLDDAATYLRTRIEAAFVPVETHEAEGLRMAQTMLRMTNALEARAEAAEARVKVLEEALISEREENLWNAYNTGHVKDGRWSHLFMSDGEWLAKQCGFDPRVNDYDDAAIRKAIPIAARQALGGEHEHR